MNKKTKLILGGLFIAAGVGLYLWNKNKDKDDAAVNCSSTGQLPCANNPSICYSPNARYNRNPCDTTNSGGAEQNIDIPSGGIDEGVGSPQLNQR